MANQSKVDFSAIPNQTIKVITNPVGFYRDMPKGGGFIEPLIFLVVMAAIAGVLTAVLSVFGFGMVGMAGMAGMAFAGFAAIIIVPIMAVIGSFIGAAIVYVIWLIMGSKESYETAYRCIAYASAIYPIMAILGIIPYLGAIVGTAWGFYLVIMASIQVHKIKANLAYIVFGIIGALLIIMQVSGEYTARNFQPSMERFGRNIENMSPEEAGKALGEFLKGLEQSQKK